MLETETQGQNEIKTKEGKKREEKNNYQ